MNLSLPCSGARAVPALSPGCCVSSAPCPGSRRQNAGPFSTPVSCVLMPLPADPSVPPPGSSVNSSKAPPQRPPGLHPPLPPGSVLDMACATQCWVPRIPTYSASLRRCSALAEAGAQDDPGNAQAREAGLVPAQRELSPRVRERASTGMSEDLPRDSTSLDCTLSPWVTAIPESVPSWARYLSTLLLGRCSTCRGGGRCHWTEQLWGLCGSALRA